MIDKVTQVINDYLKDNVEKEEIKGFYTVSPFVPATQWKHEVDKTGITYYLKDKTTVRVEYGKDGELHLYNEKKENILEKEEIAAKAIAEEIKE